MNPKKGKRENELDEEDHKIKRKKDYDSWDNLEDLMRATTNPRSYSKRDEGPSDLYAKVWEEI